VFHVKYSQAWTFSKLMAEMDNHFIKKVTLPQLQINDKLNVFEQRVHARLDMLQHNPMFQLELQEDFNSLVK